MSYALSPEVGERNWPNHEFEPVAYLESVRRFLHENGAGGMSLYITDELQDQLHAEETASRSWVMAVCEEEYASSISVEEMGWIGEGFPTVMTRLLKVSTKISKDKPDILPFTALDPDSQDRLRRHIFDEYLELSSIFTPETGSPVRGTYQLSPVLYYGPPEVRSLVAENEDLGHHNTVRALRHHPLNSQEFLDAARDNIEMAVEKFPAIPRIVIQSQVLRTPNHYEKHLLQYAEKHGINLEAGEPVTLDPSSFLGTLRGLVRSRTYQLNRHNPSAEAIEAAETLGREVLDFLGDSDSFLDERSINAFQMRVKQLTLIANRAWRHGDLAAALERSPEDFRRDVYAHLLADFTIMSAQLNSPSKAAHLALLYDSGEVQTAVAANSDLPPYVIADLLLRQGKIEDTVGTFRKQLAELERDYPRLTGSKAIRTVLSNASVPASAEAPIGSVEYTPQQFLEDARAYAQTHINAVNSTTERSKAELDRRLPEILDYFETVDWTFGGIELPEQARAALMKKAGEFITASLRAFRDGGVDATLESFTAEERHTLYGEFAENYVRIIKVLGIGSANVWKRAPALYIDAGELESLRSQYDWLKDGDFCNVVVKNPNSVRATLEKVAETRAMLQLTYPGLSDYHVNKVAVASPVTASANAIAQIRKKSEWEFGRGSDLLKEPDGKNTLKLYKHLRTLAKHDRMPNLAYFEPETEARIDDFRSMAAQVIAEQPGIGAIDEEQIDKMLSQVERYVRASEALHREDSYPSVLDLDEKARGYFVKYLYSNQAQLNELTARQMNGNWKFRTYSFGFFHDAGYLEKLWKQYEPYMPLRHVTLIALTAPRRPIDNLNDMVEYRAGLLREDPGLSADAVNAAMWDKALDKQ